MTMLYLLGIVLIHWVSVISANCPSTGEHAVEMKFYRVQKADFESEGAVEKVADAISNHGNTYCGSETTNCGFTPYHGFNDSHVVTVSGYPQNEEKTKDMLHKIYLTQSTDYSCAVEKTYLKQIIENAREDIHTSTGYWITYIDGDFYGLPPPYQLNAIIIPIGFTSLLGLIILTCALAKMSARRDAAERRQRIIDGRRSTRNSGQASSRPGSETLSLSAKPPRPNSSRRSRSKSPKKERKHPHYKPAIEMETVESNGPHKEPVQKVKSADSGHVSDRRSLDDDTPRNDDKRRQSDGTQQAFDPNPLGGRNPQLTPIDKDALSDNKKKKKPKRTNSDEQRVRRKFRKMLHSLSIK